MIPRTRQMWLLALVAVAIAAATTVPFRHLWEPDEPRYCQSAREMIDSGDWILPRLHGEPYGHKPPLFMWLVAAGRLAGLGWTAAGVIPSLLPFLVLVLLMPAMARDFGLPLSTGELAAAFFASSLLVVIMALAARMDMLFSVLLATSFWLAARLLWPARASRRSDHIALWVTLTLATLTKGPLALALFALTVAITALAARPRPSLAPLFRGPGPALAAFLILAWLIPAGARGGPDYLHEALIRQSTGRLVSSFAHPKPFYYHLVTYPATGLPFAVVSLLAAISTLRRRSSNPTTLLAAAVVAVLGFFSAVSGKLVVYLLPLFPPAALLAADAVSKKIPSAPAGLWAGTIGMAFLGVGIAIAPWLRPELDPVKAALVVAGGAMVAFAGAAGVALARRLPPLPVAFRLILAALVLPVAVVPVATRALDPTMHLATVAAAVKIMEPDARDGFVFRMNVSGPSLYSGRVFSKLRTPKELAQVLRAGRAVIVEEKNWRRVRGDLPEIATRATVFPFRTGPVFILRAAPPPATAGAVPVPLPAIPQSRLPGVAPWRWTGSEDAR